MEAGKACKGKDYPVELARTGGGIDSLKKWKEKTLDGYQYFTKRRRYDTDTDITSHALSIRSLIRGALPPR